jgi:hypothetical protein
MNINIKGIVIGLFMLIGVFYMGRCTAPTPTPTVIHESVVDSTEIETLESEVREWRQIAEDRRERLEAALEIPDPVSQPDGTKVYNVPYSDKNLSAEIGLTVEGVLEDASLEYYLKREMVTERTITTYETRILRTTRTEIRQAPAPVFNNSIQAGIKINHNFVQKPYVQYNPEIRILGINIVGTAHFSSPTDWYGAAGIKWEF